MTILEIVGRGLVFLGVPFFFAGTIGLLRFPDVYTRLHALTKVDNLGLGLLTLGLIFQSHSWLSAFKLFLIWILVIIASATACHLVARAAISKGIEPWKSSNG